MEGVVNPVEAAMRAYITGEMDHTTATPEKSPSIWAQWGLVLVVLACATLGLVFLQAQRIGSASSPLPKDHVALTWESWVFLADPPAGTKPNPIAPPQGAGASKVSLRPGDLELLTAIESLLPKGATLAIEPDPFSPDHDPAVSSVWEPLGKLRTKRSPTSPLVVLRRGAIPLSPFQTALSWSEPRSLVIVIDITDLGTDPALAIARLRKLVRHEYGHLAGSTHHEGCVMTAVQQMSAVDSLTEEFCDACRVKLKALPFPVPGDTDPMVREVNPITGLPR